MNITKRRVAFVAALVVSVLAIVIVCGLAGCSSCSRSVKSMSSDFSGGINRTVTLYDNTGKEIKPCLKSKMEADHDVVGKSNET